MHMRNIVIALLALALAAVPARGAGRLFKAFDFEERPLGNDEDVPMHWSKLVGVGLPHYVVGRLTTDRARSGRYAFRMDLDGGNCVYQYDPALLPVAVGGHYRLSGYCQTAPLKHARARLTLALADAAGQLMPGTEVRSDTYASTDDPADWHALSAELTDGDRNATYLIVRMELIQPARYATTTLGDRSLFPEDIRGSAWFDDDTQSTAAKCVALHSVCKKNKFAHYGLQTSGDLLSARGRPIRTSRGENCRLQAPMRLARRDRRGRRARRPATRPPPPPPPPQQATAFTRRQSASHPPIKASYRRSIAR